MFWRGKRVFLTGHTGFKGSWLSLWLQSLGAEVTGFALAPPTSPSLFEAASVAHGMRSVTGDISDLPHLKQALQASAPEIVIHLAAQSLVRVSYQDPILTYQTNAMGTANLLEAVRETPSVAAALVVTSDKCYENQNWLRGYREDDTLGGHDPYSNSKACAELIVSAYRSSFFNAAKGGKRPVALASARAGNVVGGGDWAQDRLVPDMVKAFAELRPVKLRNPQAIRPWQYVLEPLRGYLLLAQKLYEEGTAFAGAWNFGPYPDDAQPVCWLVESFASAWGSPVSWQLDEGEHAHEAQMLQLDWSKASQHLGWNPALRLREALSMTAAWYQHFLNGGSARGKCLEQISDYCAKLEGETNSSFASEKSASSGGKTF
jgi:CDP-glucose 4,6-dehydratase